MDVCGCGTEKAVSAGSFTSSQRARQLVIAVILALIIPLMVFRVLFAIFFICVDDARADGLWTIKDPEWEDFHNSPPFFPASPPNSRLASDRAFK